MAEPRGIPATIDELLSFLPIFSTPGYEPCEWQGGDKRPDGSITMPYPVYNPEVERMFQVYSNIWIHPYELLPEDEPGLDLQRLMFTPAYFETATYDQTRRYFALIRRRERFCDGYIESEINSGVLPAAIRRLGETFADRQDAGAT